MTTIAYKNGIVAYDSRISADNLIQDDDYEKHIVRDGIHFFVCGATEDWMKFVESYCNQTNPERCLDVSALVLHGGQLFKSSIEKTDDQFRVWKSPIRLASHISIGSGRDFALAFMDAGMTAYDAVVATTKRDMWTGGTIRTFVV